MYSQIMDNTEEKLRRSWNYDLSGFLVLLMLNVYLFEYISEFAYVVKL